MGTTGGIGGLAGGRVFKTKVPDDSELPRDSSGAVRPYVVVTFQSPFFSAQGRSVAGGEQKQPYIMPFMVTAFASDADAAEVLIDAVKVMLVGVQPTTGSGVIQLVGGRSYDLADSDSRPTRFASLAWFKVFVNLSLED